jgi:4-alpha-glucanotransferase
MEDNEKKTLAALRRQMEEMRAAYEAKIDALENECAEKKAAEVDEKKLREFLKNQEAWLNEYVEVRLFKDNEKYKDDVYVAINGKNCLIRRGVWTRIRRKFAMLLDQSEIQDLRTAELMEQEESRFADESLRHNV